MLIVRYNGKFHCSCISCTSPSLLNDGQLYEVRIMKVVGGLILYELSGINGTFLSDWFVRVAESYDKPATQVWNHNNHAKNEWQRVF